VTDIQYIDSDVEQIVKFLSQLNQAEQDQLSSDGQVRFNGSARLYDAVNNVIRRYHDMCERYSHVDTKISYYYELYGTLIEACSGLGMILRERIHSAENMILSSRMDDNEVMQAIMDVSECDMYQMHLDRVMSSLAYKTIHLLHPGSVVPR
jgi:hypothetical protein